MTHCIYQFEIACTAAERSTTNIRRSCDTKIRRFRCSIGGCRLIKPILSMVCSKKKTLIITRQLNKPGERTTHTLHFSATVPQVWSMIPVATLKRIHTHTTIGLRSGSRSSLIMCRAGETSSEQYQYKCVQDCAGKICAPDTNYQQIMN